MKQTVVALALTIVTTVANAERTPAEGKKLAGETVQLLQQLEPLAITGSGLQTTTYYKSFLKPLQAKIEKWPTLMDPEMRTWGDYLYCADAARALQTIGMTRNSGAIGDNKRIADYKSIRNKCMTASKLSPDEVQ